MDYEELIKRVILPELEAGRPDWDRPHTLAVVYYMKEILEHSEDLNLDKNVLIIAAYAHDWGYSGLFKAGQPVKMAEIRPAKPLHMEIGSVKLAELLKNKVFDFLSDEQKKRAVHLVGIHDKLGSIHDTDERVLVEADTLGALDVTKVKPTFDQDSNAQYLSSAKSKRLPLFITQYSKEQFAKLLKTRTDYYA